MSRRIKDIFLLGLPCDESKTPGLIECSIEAECENCLERNGLLAGMEAKDERIRVLTEELRKERTTRFLSRVLWSSGGTPCGCDASYDQWIADRREVCECWECGATWTRVMTEDIEEFHRRRSRRKFRSLLTP